MVGVVPAVIRELLVAGIVCILLMLGSVHTLASVQVHHFDKLGVQITKRVRLYYPRIPRCDKELWLRVRDGCVVH